MASLLSAASTAVYAAQLTTTSWPADLLDALGGVEDVEAGEVGPGHRVPRRLEHGAQVLPEHAGGTRDEPAGHQRVTTCWVRAYFASVASFIGRHHASFSRYQSMVAARPSRKLP